MNRRINTPGKIKLANLPTKIEYLRRFSEELNGPQIWIKRDDFTGSESSGNKIRKLEYVIKEASDRNATCLITCGGIQSNHARATAAVGAKLGLKVILILVGKGTEAPDGNYFMDVLFGADIRFISKEEYCRIDEIMKEVAEECTKLGQVPYIIPSGASNGIGTWGYFEAMHEIEVQEEELGFKFDAIVLAIGSGGTYTGLLLGNEFLDRKTRIVGISVGGDKEYFKKQVMDLISEWESYSKVDLESAIDKYEVYDNYIGPGYAISYPEEIAFIKELARKEGLVLDTVYTGKAMYGLVEEIKKGTFRNCERVLFIHTGGLMGLLPKKEEFNEKY